MAEKVFESALFYCYAFDTFFLKKNDTFGGMAAMGAACIYMKRTVSVMGDI